MARPAAMIPALTSNGPSSTSTFRCVLRGRCARGARRRRPAAARVAVDPALVLPLGTAAAAGAYWLALVTGLALALPASSSWPARRRRRPPAGPLAAGGRPPLRGALARRWRPWSPLLALTQYPWNRVGPPRRVPARPARALRHRLPRRPHARADPRLSAAGARASPGFPLGYHLGPRPRPRGRAALGRRRPLRLDQRLRRDALRAGPRPALRAAGARRRGLARWPWRSPAGRCWPPTSRSCSPRNPQAHWWTDLLRGNLLLSLALANPVVPGAGPGARRAGRARRAHERARARAGSRSPPLLAAAVPFFKVFLGAHLLLGLGAGALSCGRERRRAPGCSWPLPCAPGHGRPALGQGGADASSPLPRSTSCGITRETPGPRAAGAAPRSRGWAVALALAVPGPARARRARARRRSPAGPPPAAALAVMALAAWPLGLLFRVSAPRDAGRPEARQRRRVPRRAGRAAAVDLHRAGPGRAGRAGGRRRAGRRGWPPRSRCPRPSQFVVKKAHGAAPTPSRPRWCAPCARWRRAAGRATSCCSVRAPAIRRCRSCSPAAACPTSASRPG